MTVQDLEFWRALRAAHDGDLAAFEQLWRRTGPPLDRYLEVAAGERAPQVAAATWTLVATGLRSFVGDERAFRAVVARVAREEGLARRAVAGEGPPLGLPRSAGPLAVLAPDVAEMVALRTAIGLGTLETADLLGTRPGFVTVAVHGGLRRAALLSHPSVRVLALPDPWQLDRLLDRLAAGEVRVEQLTALHRAVRRLLAWLTQPGPLGDPAQLDEARPAFERSAQLAAAGPPSTVARLSAGGGPYVVPQRSF